MELTANEIQIILDALREKYGPGCYGEIEDIVSLQSKLSVMLGTASDRERLQPQMCLCGSGPMQGPGIGCVECCETSDVQEPQKRD